MSQPLPDSSDFDLHPTRKLHREYVEHIRQQLQNDPTNLERKIEYGRALYGLAIERDKTATFEAERIFAEVVRQNPTHPLGLGYTGAIRVYKIGMHLVPNEHISEQLRCGLNEMDEAIQRDSQDLELRYLRAYSSFFTPSFFGRDTKAVEDFQFILHRLENRPARSEDEAECRLTLGDTYLKMDEPEAAAAEWKRVLERFPPDSPQALSARYRLQSLAPPANESVTTGETIAFIGFLLGFGVFGVVALRIGRDRQARQRHQWTMTLAFSAALLVWLWSLANLLALGAGAFGLTNLGRLQSFFSHFQQGPALLLALLPIPVGFAVAYAIYKATFMDWLLKRGAAVLVLAILAISYSKISGAVAQATVLRLSNPSLRAIVFTLLPMGVMALFVPLNRWVNRAVDRLVFKRRNPEQLLEWFGDRLRNVTDETEFSQILSETLGEAFSTDSVQVWLAEDERTQKLVAECTSHQLLVLETDTVVDDRLFEDLQRKSVRLVLLVQAGTGPAGIVTLGPRTLGLGYLSEEQNLLRVMAVEAGRALENLRLHENQRRERTAQEALRNLISEAELRALRAQINPHFFFNALNSVAALIGDDPQQAEELLADVADFFRHAFHESRAWHSLREELELVEAYLKIEKVRLGKRLHVRLVVPEALTSWRIPALSIQPLIENAVKHGIGKIAQGGMVTLSVAQLGDQLEIFVADTGCGMSASELNDVLTRGVGLSNVNRRLQGLFGPQAGLRVDSRPGEGTTVSFTVPPTAEPITPIPEGVNA
ncbi:MAG: histidine kinase [Blastocatellia bacterium]|nr:histidine kinase [Blastocatellia bacterium]